MELIEKKKKNKDIIFFSIFAGTCSEGGRNSFIERKSNFSLDFPAFGPSVLVGARGEVDIRCKGYAWTPIL